MGHEADYTQILNHLDETAAAGLPFSDPHPNDTGYAVIAQQMEAVSEPSSWVLLGTGTLVLLASAWRHRERIIAY